MTSSKASFFRQSGWMVIATFLGGIFMFLVQSVTSKMDRSEWSVFNALLGLIMVLGGAPSAALQTLFAQQAAAAVTEETHRKLVATTRMVLKGGLILFTLVTVLGLLAINPICRVMKIDNPAALVLTLAIVLPTVWQPVFKGLLQGLHRFAGLGWLQILDGAVRFGAVLALILGFNGQAAGAMSAVLAGQLLVVLIGAWLTRDIWSANCDSSVSAAEWKLWIKRYIPLTLGLGTVVLMTSVDRPFVQSVFSDSHGKDLYLAAMFIGFGVVQFIAPITSVMFPHIVRSIARAERSDALVLTVIVTGGFAALAALGCTLCPSLPLRILFFSTPAKVNAAPLVPWFAWALMPLTLANVLVQNLLARERFAAMPWLFGLALMYLATLRFLSPTLLDIAQTSPLAAFTRIIQVLGGFNVLLFVVAAWFTWRKPSSASGREQPGRSACDKATAPAEKRTS